MKVITRFAPSPTGTLHIGSARTALFNFLYAKHMKGSFLLRVEDTDKERSKEEFTKKILDSLRWLNINHDGDVVFQSRNIMRHQNIAHQLIEEGKAYYCLSTQEEVLRQREIAEKNRESFIFRSEWRDKNITLEEIQKTNKAAVVRLKIDHTGTTAIGDLVQGEVKVRNDHLDDMVILRSDGTPTYMLAVVVDDYYMNVNHVIRGDDHLNNTFRQIQLYKALGWQIPKYAHIPLIHARDGTKLSKRHGAIGVEEYKEQGFLSEALNNYLLRLGWSHGNEEIISREDAIKWFDVSNINKASARIDNERMLYVNSRYILEKEDHELIECLTPFLKKMLNAADKEILYKGLKGLKCRAETLLELANSAQFYLEDDHDIQLTIEAKTIVNNADSSIFNDLIAKLEEIDQWNEEIIKSNTKNFIKNYGLKLGQIGPVIRSVLSGDVNAPSIFEIMFALGKEKTLKRMKKYFS